MNILLITALFPPYHRGGAEVAVTNSARALSAHHDVTVLTTCPWRGFASMYPREDTETKEQFRVMRFFPFNLFSFVHIAKYPAYLRLIWHAFDMVNIHAYWVTRRLVKTLKPDVVITHNLKGIGYTIPRAVGASRVPWIHVVHDLGALYPRGVLEYGKEQSADIVSLPVKLYGAINRWLFGSPPVVIARSQFFLDYIAKRGWFRSSKRVRVLSDVAPRALTHAQEPRGVYKFVFIGQLEAYKGIDTLLEAYALVRKKHTATALHIVGNGSMTQRVRTATHADASIIWHGDQRDLSAIMPTMHAAVIPTLVYENTPLVLIEALLAGLPVIASDIGGVGEAIRGSAAGVLVEPGNPVALCAAMETVMQSDWHAMHTAALRAGDPYDIKHLDESIQRLIHDVQSPGKAL